MSPSGLTGEQWRRTVRQQPIAEICRDALIMNLVNLEYDINVIDPDVDTTSRKKDIQYYMDLLENAEGDFDNFIDLVGQDLLDLPFGGAVETVRENDDPEGRIIELWHIDAGTLFPTLYPEVPVAQRPPDRVNTIYYPSHAIGRLLMSPRPELTAKGWGMAPPEKIYLAIRMLYTKDEYSAKMMVDTPEAGILDLGDMSKESAEEWLDSFREMFTGIDPFKVPVLYEHTTTAKFIPFGRSPADLMVDKTAHTYAQMVAAGYGLRLSDIGLEDQQGEKTMAGVIRGERQSKRSGYATVEAKFENFFNRLLKPEGLKFVWIAQDSEDNAMRSRGMAVAVTALNSAIESGIISREEGRQQLIADGHFTIGLDPDDMPEPPAPTGGGGIPGVGSGSGAQASNTDESTDRVPAAEGGRGVVARTINRFFNRRQIEPEPGIVPPTIADTAEVFKSEMNEALNYINSRMEASQVKRLLRPAVKALLPTVARVFQQMTSPEIRSYWLPQMEMVTFGGAEDTDFSPEAQAILRADEEDYEKALEKLLSKEDWWSIDTAISRGGIAAVLARAVERGLYETAIEMATILYENGIISSTALIRLSFELTNPQTLANLDAYAGEFIRRIDDGTRFYIRRAILGGVREGMASDRIANLIRQGVGLDELLEDEGFVNDAVEAAREKLRSITPWRLESIVNTEINRAENDGRLLQIKKLGLGQKAWRHLGGRGTTEAGNEHPCVYCAGNEELGFVPLDFMYDTVFGEKESPTPPGHPRVCHCTILFNKNELIDSIKGDTFTPYTGD